MPAAPPRCEEERWSALPRAEAAECGVGASKGTSFDEGVQLAGIFISYRREDSAGWTRSLAADLAHAFPEHRVFHDIASIEVGEDFVDAIRRELPSCNVVLVVIGPHWLRVSDEVGKRRLAACRT